jgi:hypothetical protein
MPAKTVTCAICGEEVTKRQTYSIGDGKRACKKHEETQEKATELRQAEKDAKADQRQKAEEKKKQRKRKREAHMHPLKPHCFLCHKEGMHQADYFYKVLLEQQKYEIVHGEMPNPFDEAQVKASLEAMAGIDVLWFVNWSGKNTKIRIPFQLYQLMQIVPHMLVCDECCKKKGFVRAYDENVKDITYDQLVRHAVIFETYAEPILKAQAQKELSQRN